MKHIADSQWEHFTTVFTLIEKTGFFMQHEWHVISRKGKDSHTDWEKETKWSRSTRTNTSRNGCRVTLETLPVFWNEKLEAAMIRIIIIISAPTLPVFPEVTLTSCNVWDECQAGSDVWFPDTQSALESYLEFGWFVINIPIETAAVNCGDHSSNLLPGLWSLFEIISPRECVYLCTPFWSLALMLHRRSFPSHEIRRV